MSARPTVNYTQTELLPAFEGCTFTPDNPRYPIIHLTMGPDDEVLEESFLHPTEPFVHFRVRGEAKWEHVPRLIDHFARKFAESAVNGFRDILRQADLVYLGPRK